MSAREGHPEKADELTAKTGFSEEIEDADEADIESLVGSLPAPDAAAVYDVGQGSSNAALRDGIPVLYFDVGGGATQEKLEIFGGQTSLGRAGQPVELASIYVQLAANDASFTTGQVYGAAGGTGQP